MGEDYFPFDTIRPQQHKLIEHINEAIKNHENLIVHAPTGLGKTAGSIAPALNNAIKDNRTIYFLTSRLTQHKLAIDTIKAIKNKHNLQLISTDIIGKKHLCLQPAVNTLQIKDFNEYCRALREDGRCSYYNNLKQDEKISERTKAALGELQDLSPVNPKQAKTVGEKYEVCPYELSILIGKKSKIKQKIKKYIIFPHIS